MGGEGACAATLSSSLLTTRGRASSKQAGQGRQTLGLSLKRTSPTREQATRRAKVAAREPARRQRRREFDTRSPPSLPTLEGALVRPILVADPTILEVVETVEEVLWKLARRPQIRVHAARYAAAYLDACAAARGVIEVIEVNVQQRRIYI